MKAGEIDKKPGDRENSAKNGSLPAKPGELAGLPRRICSTEASHFSEKCFARKVNFKIPEHKGILGSSALHLLQNEL